MIPPARRHTFFEDEDDDEDDGIITPKNQASLPTQAHSILW